MWQIAKSTFAAGGDGAVIITIAFIAVGGWLFGNLVSSLGRGRAAQLINVATDLSCFIACVGTIFLALKSIAKALGN